VHNVKPRLKIACVNCLASVVNNPRLAEEADASLDMADRETSSMTSPRLESIQAICPGSAAMLLMKPR